ncbi:radical SAM domain protein [Teredinibacter turnerae T7901]|uniref:7-carboxy-7-deazaguanine synthase n=1 Tax=Teredinibacter turnerae (strain ATCC 39867 / T7901) TaxID=377629 RepID=C5BQS6_TERTT|nr:7-carboxy-7-deazaguanine synthase QueE [Teredinibacter turnerae]ACR12562.1 radical SAM domain protein [Teredinibacter turnerae T7901]
MTDLRITEIFHSLQGEARTVGVPTVFVRLTGCPLRCQYCDSEYAFFGGEKKSLDEIEALVIGFRCSHVCVTGGEPLAQPNCIPLLERLCDAGLAVSLETSGAMDISAVDTRVSIVLDLKTPDSGERDKNLLSNIPLLAAKDQIKFVICSRSDYEWARFMLDEQQLVGRVGDIFFSPSYTQLAPAELAQWILDDRLPVRFQMQLHKQLWGDKAGV